MTGLWNLIRRNCKLFFKDKGMFFPSLITPVILLVLYGTFLAKVYRESFISSLPLGFSADKSIINAIVGGQLTSSLLAVSCVTVAFCSNLIMVTDRANNTIHDIKVTPVKRSALAIGYFVSSSFTTLIITFTALSVCFIYLLKTGWYLSGFDVFCMILDVVLVTLFGVSLSSCINYFLTTQGQVSAFGTIVSSGYGFLCGAYMPISTFPEGLQKILSFLPGTYGTSLLRNHAMRGAYAQMAKSGFPADVIEKIKDSIDCNLYWFGNKISISVMYAIISVSVVVLVGIYVLMNISHKNSN